VLAGGWGAGGSGFFSRCGTRSTWLALRHARSLSDWRAYLLCMMASNSVNFVVQLPQEFANEPGVAGAFLRFRVVARVRIGDGQAVGTQVRHEIRREFVGHETGAEGGLGGLHGGRVGGLVFEAQEQGVGVGGGGALGNVGGQHVGRGKAVLLERDGLGGAREVREVQAEGVEEGFLADAGGPLAGLGDVKLAQEPADGGGSGLCWPRRSRRRSCRRRFSRARPGLNDVDLDLP